MVGKYAYFAPDDAPAALTKVSADLAGAYVVRASASADLVAAYAVRASTSTSLAASYSVRGQVSGDLLASYAISSASKTSVSTDLSGAYGVRAAVAAKLDGSYGVRAAVARDGVFAYAINAAPVAGNVPTGLITVPTARVAAYSSWRVIVFGVGSSGSKPDFGLSYRTGKWYLNKGARDKLWYVGDFTKDLTDGLTTAKSVVAITAGVTVLQGPTIQGNLVSIMLGGGDAGLDDNFCTLRITTASGEVIDGTIHFVLVEDRLGTFAKDPNDQRFYAADFSYDAALSGTSVASVDSGVIAGISLLLQPVIQGNRIIVKLGGLNTTGGANTCPLTATMANGEQLTRTLYFTEVDN